jgi:outer membrane protein assembly factor BamD
MLHFRRSVALVTSVVVTTLAGCAGNDLPVDATPDDIMAHAERKLAARDYYDAAQSLEHFIRAYPGTARIPTAKLRLGDARYGMEEYILARGEYEDVVEDYPASDLVEEARYKIARCSYASIFPPHLDQTETERCIHLFEDFLRDYPQSRFRAESSAAVADCRGRLAKSEFESGKFYERQGRLRSAKIQYDYVVETYPETASAPEAALRIGELYRERKRWDEAQSWYRRVITDYPETEQAGLARRAIAEIEGGSSS